MAKGIVLCSGGLDSALALIKCQEDTEYVTCLFVDYGQYPVERERGAFYSIYRQVGSKTFLPVELKLEIQGPPNNNHVGSVWNRTMALVGIASMWAYINGNDYDYIAVGSHKGDVGPDIKPGEYDSYLNAALLQGTKDQVSLRLPIADLSIEDIGLELVDKVPFEIMYSCYWDPPCGFKSENEKYRFPGLRRKTLAMKVVGIPDVLLDYPNGNYGGRTCQSNLAEKVNY